MLLHGTCVSRSEVGVLIRGASRSGKSLLALRLLSAGFDLVADDCVLLHDGKLTAPKAIAGLIEVRGLGVYRMPHAPAAALRLVVQASCTEKERIAEARTCHLTGAPMITLDLLSASAPDIVGLAAACLAGQVVEIAGPLTSGKHP